MRAINPAGLCANRSAHGEEQFQAEWGTWLCGWCADVLRDRCQDLVKMWPVLEAALHPVPGPPDGEARATRTAAPLPLNADVVDLMVLAADKVRAIVSEIVELRMRVELAKPEKSRLTSSLRILDETTPGLLEWLEKWHLSWALGWRDESLVLGIWDDMAEVWDKARRYTGAATVTLEEVGWQCIHHELVAGRMVRCEGKLLRAVHSQAGQETDVRCSADKSHRWPMSEWHHLMKRVKILGDKAERDRADAAARAAATARKGGA